MTLNPQIKLILDILPLAVFFAGYKWLGVFGATALLLASTLFVVVITYAVERRISLGLRITVVMVIILGGLTLFLHDERFLKIKPTLIYSAFAVILFTGFVFKKNLLKPLLGTAIHLTDRGWHLLTLRWASFFIFLAVLNEIVWRNFSTDIWVNFKVFGIITLIMIFAVLQAGLIQRHLIPAPEKENPPIKNPD